MATGFAGASRALSSVHMYVPGFVTVGAMLLLIERFKRIRLRNSAHFGLSCSSPVEESLTPFTSIQDCVLVLDTRTCRMGSPSTQPFAGLRRRTSPNGKTSHIRLLAFLGVSTVLFCFSYQYRSQGRVLLDEGSLIFGGSTGRSTGMGAVRHAGRRDRDRERGEFVRDMMRHAWTGYETYAWGMDELNPVSCTGKLGVMGGRNGFSGLGASLVDAMSTLHLMGMEEEFDRAKSWVRDKMEFSRGGEQQISCMLSRNR